MHSETDRTSFNPDEKYKVWFFAGGETHDNKFNIFTRSFIDLMTRIMNDDFEFIKGIFFKTAMMNVIWALNNAQKPVKDPDNNKITSAAFSQITSDGHSPDTRLVIISSSTGSIVAAQTACYLAEKNRSRIYFRKPFHLVLGASMISPESTLYRQLISYQKEGTIGTIIHDEIQDEGDNSAGVGGRSRWEAYRNAFGLMLPFLSGRFSGPSFLNAHHEKGHIHRKRSKTVQKAKDYIEIILVQNQLAGKHYRQVAEKTLKELENASR